MNTDKLMELERKWRATAKEQCLSTDGPYKLAEVAMDVTLTNCADELAAALRAEQAVGDEQRARELLAEELKSSGFAFLAQQVRDGTATDADDSEEPLNISLRAIRRALGAARQSEGVVLVPREPTEAMKAAGDYDKWNYDDAADIYRAMIDAAPKHGEDR